MTTTYIAWTDANKNLNVLPVPADQQVQPVPTGQSLNQSSNYGPALAFYNGLLYLGWTGTDGQLNVISSSDGATWNNQVTIPNQKSNNAPALVASGNSLSLAWIGTDGQLNMIFSSDGKNWKNQVTSSQTSEFQPASAAGPYEVPILAWTGAKGVLSTLSGMGIPVAQGAMLKPTAKEAPALAFYNGLLYLAWTDDTTGNLNVMSSSDGITFTNQVNTNQTPNSGPALTASSSSLSLAWIDANGKLTVSNSSDGKTWGSTITVSGTSSFTPALAVADF